MSETPVLLRFIYYFAKIRFLASQLGSEVLIKALDDLGTDGGSVFVGLGLSQGLVHQAVGEAISAEENSSYKS